MNRNEFEKYILDAYGTEADRPWAKYPDYEVYRHDINRKWFALVMEVEKSRFGLCGNELISVVNLKCGPFMSGSLRQENGIFPAYHMNKENWITVLLDGTVPDETLKVLIDMSYSATAPKIKKIKKKREK